jgi:hypothetical protein
MVRKSGRMRKAGHVACMRGRDIHRMFCSKHTKRRHYLESLDVDGNIILIRIKKYDIQWMENGFKGTRIWLSGTRVFGVP